MVYFKDPALFFKYIIEEEVLTETEISNFKSIADFKNLKSVPSVTETFYNLVLIPPFIALVILSASSYSISKVAAVIKLASNNFEMTFDSSASFHKL